MSNARRWNWACVHYAMVTNYTMDAFFACHLAQWQFLVRSDVLTDPILKKGLDGREQIYLVKEEGEDREENENCKRSVSHWRVYYRTF